jgi:hypothetical protein
MQSQAKTVKEYLDSLPADRVKVITTLRNQIKKNLPKGFKEVMTYGTIGYVVPHTLYPNGYHVSPDQPLPFICIASQKNHIAVYHMALYEGDLLNWFKSAWVKATGKKLDMGKSCIRFKKPEDIPLALMGELAARMTPQQWIEAYEHTLLKAKRKQ